MRTTLLLVILTACSLNVDYTGTYYQCNPDGTCPPDHVCQDMVCVPTDPVPPACSKDISAGGAHSCAVREDGSVWCWGRNDKGQLGDTTAVDASEPVQTMGMTNAVSVGAGDLFTCALDTMGAVFCWGFNESGQLGDGQTTDSRAPVKVFEITGATQLSVGDDHACVLMGDASVRCWGGNSDGQLGDGTMTYRSSPTTVASLPPSKQVSAGGETTCSIGVDGLAHCWGENNDGELGVGDALPHPRPTAVVDLTNIVDVATGNDVTCAVTDAFFVFCWGANDVGQLGTGTSSMMPTTRPTAAVISTGMLSVEAGNDHVCTVDGQDRLWCWGEGYDGRLGSNTGTRYVPTRSALDDVLAVSAGGEHTCVLDRTGAIRCAGFNRRGQLGDGRSVTRGTPELVPGITNAVSIVAGGRHTCASLMDGRVMCWGENDEGEAGNGSFIQRQSVPSVVDGILNPVELVAGVEHTCARLADGSIYCWGDNDDGRLGDGTINTSAQARPVNGIVFPPTKLAIADNATCGLFAGGARCWGNMFGLMPVTVADVKHIAGGGGHICTVEQDNTVMCYGQGSSYQLGNGSQMFNPAAPGVVANGVTGAVEVYARGDSSCARLMDGTVKCWGINDGGRLGVGNGNYHTQNPTLVMGLSGVMKLAMGYDASCAIKTDGAVWCWGLNYLGQVGDNSYATRTAPVPILGLSAPKDVASGGAHSCAINGDGTVACWGLGGSGQLGNGIASITTPVGVRMTCP